MSSPTLPSESSGSIDSSLPESSQGLVPLKVTQNRSLLGDRWEITGVLGEGGTAVVYRAYDRQTSQPVAVKLLHREMARERSMRERFRREAYAANLVQHPDVVKIIADGEQEDGQPYLVMEFLEGETLDQRLERKGQRLPATEVLWAIDKVLDVLAAAHGRGIVHRDLKPENIFLTHDRRIKVLDFGLARLKEDASHKLTQIGYVMGTPSFMPPEQALGQWDQVDVQTDLWAVGATMFTLLSGRLVHEGSKVHDVVAAATRNAAPSLREVAPHLPEAIVEVVDFALAFEMSRRWRSARLMQHALRQAYHRLRTGDTRDDTDELAEVEAPTFDATEDPEPPPQSLRSGAIPRGAPAPQTLVQPTRSGLPSLNADSVPPPPGLSQVIIAEMGSLADLQRPPSSLRNLQPPVHDPTAQTIVSLEPEAPASSSDHPDTEPSPAPRGERDVPPARAASAPVAERAAALPTTSHRAPGNPVAPVAPVASVAPASSGLASKAGWVVALVMAVIAVLLLLKR